MLQMLRSNFLTSDFTLGIIALFVFLAPDLLQAQSLQVDAGVDTVICLTNDNQPDTSGLEATVTGGTPPYVYQWSTEADTSVNYWLSDSTVRHPEFLAQWPTIGPQAFYVQVTDSNQEIARDTVMVEICGSLPVPQGCGEGLYPTVGDTIMLELRSGYTCKDSLVWSNPNKIISQDDESMTIQVLVDDPSFDYNSFTADIYDENGCQASGGFTCPFVVEVYPLAVDEQGVENELTLYPNPTDGAFRITNLQVGTEVVLYTSAGSLLMSRQAMSSAMDIDQALTPGVYFLHSSYQGQVKTSRLVITPSGQEKASSRSHNFARPIHRDRKGQGNDAQCQWALLSNSLSFSLFGNS